MWSLDDQKDAVLVSLMLQYHVILHRHRLCDSPPTQTFLVERSLPKGLLSSYYLQGPIFLMGAQNFDVEGPRTEHPTRVGVNESQFKFVHWESSLCPKSTQKFLQAPKSVDRVHTSQLVTRWPHKYLHYILYWNWHWIATNDVVWMAWNLELEINSNA